MNGRPGLRAVEERLPSLREELDLDFVVANGENAADGVGITPKLADRLLASGVDVLTQLWFPYRYWELALHFRALESWLVLARDLALVALLVVLLRDRDPDRLAAGRSA